MNNQMKPLAVSQVCHWLSQCHPPPPTAHCPLFIRNLQFAICIVQFAFFWLILAVTPLAAQVERLPTVISGDCPDFRINENGTVPFRPSPDEKYPGKLVSHPDSSAEILQAPGGTAADVSAEPPRSDVRSGMFQKLIFSDTWLARGIGSRGFGQNDLESKIILALPCPTREQPLVITPGFTVHYLDGPAGVDLPPRLFDAYTQFRWLSQVTPQWGLDMAITPGVYSDFDQGSDDAFRLTGHGAAAWTCNPQTKFVLGAAYLDRLVNNVIPIGGVIWTPNDDTKFDLIFPHPKISRRVHFFDNFNPEVETWAYILGETAGDAWAISHADGSNGLIDLSDYRFILGLERKTCGGLTASVEVGYVFGRKIRFSGDYPNFEPQDTVLLRGGLMY
jgi:hypothetical protein